MDGELLISGLIRRLGRGLFTLAAACTCLPAVAAEDRFDVWEYRVRGNTVIEQTAVEKAVYGHLGPGKTIADIESARTALEEAYRAAGYPTVLVDVPEQDVANGIVQLKVTEGRVDRLLVTGARYFENGWIREQIPELAPGSVPRLATFQTELRALNARSPDRSITPVLRPGRKPGTVEAELKVADELPMHGAVEVNNRNTAGTTDTRLGISASYGNLWQREHALSVQYQVAPENSAETEVWAGSYSFKPGRSDKTVVFYGVDSNSDIATVADTSVIGNGWLVGTQFIWPLPSSASLYHNAILGLAWKNFDEVIGFNAEDEADIETPIAYLNWSAGYSATVVGDTRTQGFTLTANFGVRGLGNQENVSEPNASGTGYLTSGEFEDKRYGAEPNYFYLNGRYEISQAIPWDSTLYLNVGAQLSPQPLVSNEQFAIGGLDSVRGYFEAELLGDYGVQTTLEWQSPNVGQRLWKPLQQLQGLLFVDVGHVGIHDALPDQIDSYTVWSAGLGLKLAAAGFVGTLDWAWPFRDGTDTESGDDRVLFKVRYGF